MEALAHMLVAATDLVEAEGRVLRGQVLRVTVLVVAALLSIVLVFVGVGFLLYGLLLFISQFFSPPSAAILVGLVTVGFSLGALWTTRKMLNG